MLAFIDYVRGDWAAMPIATEEGKLEHLFRIHILRFYVETDQLTGQLFHPLTKFNDREFLGIKTGFLRCGRFQIDPQNVHGDIAIQETILGNVAIQGEATADPDRALQLVRRNPMAASWVLEESSRWEWNQFFLPTGTPGRVSLKSVPRHDPFDFGAFFGADDFKIDDGPK